MSTFERSSSVKPPDGRRVLLVFMLSPVSIPIWRGKVWRSQKGVRSGKQKSDE